MGPGNRRAAAGEVSRNASTVATHPVVLADEALVEFEELISYINKSSPKSALAVYDAISRRLLDVGVNPRIGHADPITPSVPPGALALITTVKKVTIYYLFPMTRQGQEIVYVLSIRRGLRMPLEDPEYARLWNAELAKLAPPQPTDP